MRKEKIRNIKKGEYIRFSPSETSPVWIRGEYIRELKKYSLTSFDDHCREKPIKGDRHVYVDFEF